MFTQHPEASNVQHEGEESHHISAPTGEHEGETGGNLFTELLHHVYDAHELELPFVGHVDLPYVIYDGGTAHVYKNSEVMREEGTFTIQNEKIIRASDHQKPSLDLSITKHVVFLWVAAVILIVLAITAARKNLRRKVPRGVGNLVEMFVVFVRDEIVVPNMGPTGVKYMPYLLTTFFFILVMNLAGLVPYGSTATGNVSVTGGLALIAFIMIQFSAIRAQGLGHYLHHLTGGVHWALWPIMVPIEILGLFTKPFALMIRLFANMIGGHIVIVSLIGLIFIFKSYIIAAGPVLFVLGISMLELFVAFLQAYIFTMLTSLFMGLGMQVAHEEGEGHGH
ncbi:MAG: F0F1 ATP synthase subunit A [Ignavibacteria bacterium]|nr:F0F1 ATP synthase subunit A [Ignavibacteria bacterium]MBI3765389.1 F0F1 ATP synthase subunit A [Ignavibacteriales bacterium]